MTDILSIQPAIRTLVVKHPATGRPVGLEIDFRSMDSPEVQAVERTLRGKALRGGQRAPSMDNVDQGEYAILHALIAAWRWSGGIDLAGDKNPSLTSANTEKLFRSAPWLKKQLNTELGDEASFFETAPSSSETQ